MRHASPSFPAIAVAVLAWMAFLLIAASVSPTTVGTTPSPAPGPVVAPNVHGGAR